MRTWFIVNRDGNGFNCVAKSDFYCYATFYTEYAAQDWCNKANLHSLQIRGGA